MRTDWALVRRLAFEVDTRLRGARVQDAGTLADGRYVLSLWHRGSTVALALDLFGTPPVVTLEHDELSADEPGFARSLARTLRGFTLQSVRAREHDRVISLNFRTRSRFGIDDEVALSIELVPRFGNAVLVKNGIVIDAAKEFALGRSARVTLPGHPYEPPPAQSARLPRLVEESGAPPEPALAALEGDAVLSQALYVYRDDGGTLLQAHLLPLPQLSSAALSREASLLDLLAEDRTQRIGDASAASTEQRRSSILRKVEMRLRRVRTAQAALEARRAESDRRDDLRREGDAIYASLHELGPQAQGAAKERAAKLFARYRKLATAVPHIDTRRRSLELERESLETLQWEAQRSPQDSLDEILASLDPGSGASPARKQRKRRAPLVVQTPSGSRILVGRSPLENADLTFRVARPVDLWFHARGVPGAHVILARDDRSPPPGDDIALAAALAAAHSKARESAKVPVDYTQRKHVRKRPNAAPGLVFYTGAKTIVVTPARDGGA